jgi:hypothetical protein
MNIFDEQPNILMAQDLALEVLLLLRRKSG